MATTSPAGIYYRTQAEVRPTDEAMALSLATSVNNAIGLVPIVPASVSVGSGTASVSSLGLVTFSGCSTVTVNGVFSSSYSNYRVVMDGTIAADNGIRIRMDNFTGANYAWQWIRAYGTTVQALNETANTTGIYVSSGDADGVSFTADIFSPNKVSRTNLTFQGFGSSGVDFIYIGSGQVTTTTQYTGATLAPNGGTTVSGTVRFYGYN